MSFAPRCVAGLATLLVPIAGGRLAARNLHGFIESDQWACLVPLSGGDCAGGDTHSMLENWVWPHFVSLESPVIGTEWNDIAFGDKARSASWLGEGRPTFVSTGTGADGDVVDWEEFLEMLGRSRDFVMGIAVTYVRNTTGAPLHAGLCTASDDSIQVWINNTLALNLSACRALDSGCAEVTPIVLAPGVNRVTVLVWQGFGGFGFRLGFRKSDGAILAETDPEIEYLGASDSAGVTDPLPFLTRSYAGSYFYCANATHAVHLSGGPGFEDAATYRVREDLRGPLSASDVSRVSDGGVVETVLAEATRAGDFDGLVVGTPCSPDNSTVFSNGIFTTRATTGGDIWTDGDTCELTFQRLEGDFDMAVEMVAKRLPAGGRWGKFGLMARQSLDTRSKLTAILDHGPDPALPERPDAASCARRAFHLEVASMDEAMKTAGMEDPNDHSSLEHPRFLRLTRRGSLVETWVSNTAGKDGLDPARAENWVRICGDDWSGSPAEILVGFVYSVHSTSGCATGEIDWRLLHPISQSPDLGPPPVGATIAWNVPGSVLGPAGLTYSVASTAGFIASVRGSAESATTAGPEILAFQGAPSGRTGAFDSSLDIGEGGPCTPGSLSWDGRVADDVYTITASGSDIWDGGDQFHFAYKAVKGDFAVQARFTDVRPPETGGRWGKLGLMARWDCRPNSAYFYALDSAASDSSCYVDGPRTSFRARGGVNGGSGEPDAVWWQDVFGSEPMSPDCAQAGTNPRAGDLIGDERNRAPWLRLVRRGNTFYGYASDDALDWRILGAHSWSDAPAAMVVGVAVTSHARCEVESVTFDHFEIGPAPPLDGVIAGDDPLDGMVMIDEHFDKNARCPAGWICSHSSDASSLPSVTAGRLRLAIAGASGENTATSAFLAKPFDPRRASLFDFDVRFSYNLAASRDRSPPADGLTFCVLGTLTGTDFLDLRLGDSGGGLGYNRINMSLDETRARTRDFSLNSFAIELDIWHNGDSQNDGDGANVSGWNQLGGRIGTGTGAYHVGLDVNASAVSAQRNLDLGVRDEKLPDVYDPLGIHVRVLYDHGHVKAWVRSNPANGDAMLPVLDGEIEPLELNSPFAIAGFTAATGRASCTMDVDNFVMRDLLEREAAFHRGDADDNGKLEITDAVRVLGFLFLGTAPPPCLDAADADDNGALEITDAVRILGFLFLGTVPPAAPGPPPSACGPDRPGSPGDLGCVSYTSCP